MICNTETYLHTLLDGLTNGEHIKATWMYDEHTVTAEGPAYIYGQDVRCDREIRWEDGSINRSLTSLEVARDEEVTVTRDDEEALHALIDSLEGGETVTAEWRNSDGSMSITGKAWISGLLREVNGYGNCVLRYHDGVPHQFLHSVTARRPVVQRWERDGDE